MEALIDQARAGNRCELVLSGPTVRDDVAEAQGCLNEKVFALSRLNFLEVKGVGLTSLSDGVGRLVSLTTLDLHSNLLTSLPAAIGQLSQLKILDVSDNRIIELEPSLGLLVNLHTLNLRQNQLKRLPDLSGLANLHLIDFSNNRVTDFPEFLADGANLKLLSEIYGAGNCIEAIPSTLSHLEHLKVFDLSENQLTAIPAELALCQKLKQLDLKENPVSDRRLRKLIAQCQTRSVLDYLRPQLKSKSSGGRTKQTSTSSNGPAAGEVDTVAGRPCLAVLRPDPPMLVRVTAAALAARPFIVCCTIHGLALGEEGALKQFLKIQTELHDGVCEHRQLATIATHDLKKVHLPLVYDARPPDTTRLTPLSGGKELTARQLLQQLRLQADQVRKQKKRNNVTGLHRYLDLLKGKEKFPFLVDADDTVISFPPITNCLATRLSPEADAVLLEVSSSKSLPLCVSVMEALVHRLVDVFGAGGADATVDGSAGDSVSTLSLRLGQVRVVDHENSTNMRVVFPTRGNFQDAKFSLDF